MNEIAQPSARRRAAASRWSGLLRKDDWWAIWIGLGLVIAAILLFAEGSSIKWIAIAPQKWASGSGLAAQLAPQGARYAALFLLWSISLGIGAAALGIRLSRFLPAFLALFVAAVAIYVLGMWDQAARYNLEPPLVALALGLLLSNTSGVPRWLEPALRVELYIKTGIVLLGAGLPLTLIAWAGPVAIVQAAIVSIATFGTIYAVGVKLGLDRRLAATLGTGGAVCGVSGAIAIGGAVGAKKEQVSIAISLVVVWAIVMIFALPLVARALHLPTGVAGAWIGTSEFADAAGLAAAQTYGGYAGNVAGIAGSSDAAVNAFTLMKVIGRDVWIGVWAFVLSLVATTRWERTGIDSRADAGEIWRRFPKFVLGFLAASAVVTLVSKGYTYAEYKKDVLPSLVAPLQSLRTWVFTFAFLSIGLTTKVREFVSVGARPLYAFSAGVAINVVLGFVLSTQVFSDFWSRLGQ
ncbi:MAG TPA: putative sulfate exporter family transporter [Steroidobacteraceae bacterium]|nr:putative sulfate exporter family transporter [Steroidobacteraceae bacterium]